MTTASLTLIRGLPGSGKSTLAKRLPGKCVEADMFFISKNGEYCFRPDLLPQAHQWCQQETKRLLLEGQAVVVANTFIEKWEMSYYLELAKALNVPLDIIEAQGDFKNIHGVPKAVVEQMRRRFEVL